MSRDLTEIEQEYLTLDCDCIVLRQFIGDRRRGAEERSFSAETREACARDVAEAEAELAQKEERMRALKPQFEIDQAKRHARDMEKAKARRRKQRKLKM